MLTNEQRELRKKLIGASDIPAILGLSPWRSAADVWLEKTGRMEEQKPTEAMEVGTRLEPIILDWAQDQIGVPVVRDTQFVHPNGVMVASLDGLVTPDQHVEAKYTTQVQEWGDEGTDDIPDYYLAQVAAQFACVPASRLCWVPVLMPAFGFKFKMFKVQRDEALIAAVTAAAVEFHKKHIAADVAPDDFRPSIDVAKHIKRTEGKTIVIPELPVTLFKAAQLNKKKANEEFERAQADLLACIGDADTGDYGRGVVTYKLTKRAGYTVQPTEYRTLRVKEAK